MAASKKAGDKPAKLADAVPAAAKPKTAKAVAPTKTSTAKKSAVAEAPVEKIATPVAEQSSTPPVLTPDQRRYHVELAAYYIAERRGFHGGSEIDDWVQAELEVDRLIREGVLKP